MIRARLPTSSSTRCFISAAALLVNVIARMDPGCAFRSEMSHAIRRVSTRVLPDPAPATTSNGDPSCTTAARWGSLRPSSSCSAVGPPAVFSAGAARCSNPGRDSVVMFGPAYVARPPAGSEQAAVRGPAAQLVAGGELQLAEHAGHVGLDRLDRDEQ